MAAMTTKAFSDKAQLAVYEWRAFTHATLTQTLERAYSLMAEASRKGSPITVNARGLQEFSWNIGEALMALGQCEIEPPTEVEVPDPLAGLAAF